MYKIVECFNIYLTVTVINLLQIDYILMIKYGLNMSMNVVKCLNIYISQILLLLRCELRIVWSLDMVLLCLWI